MNLKELKERIDRELEFCRNPEEVEVVITTSEPSIGGRAKCGIKHVFRGCDWERNEFRIQPMVSLKKEEKEWKNFQK